MGLQPLLLKFHSLMRLSVIRNFFSGSLWCFCFRAAHGLLVSKHCSSAADRLGETLESLFSLILLSSYQNSSCEPHFKGHRLRALIIFLYLFFRRQREWDHKWDIMPRVGDYIWQELTLIGHSDICYTEIFEFLPSGTLESASRGQWW